jgi:hypothetical protein
MKDMHRGFVINGKVAGDQSGYSVSSAGDVNGDGLDDLIDFWCFNATFNIFQLYHGDQF